MSETEREPISTEPAPEQVSLDALALSDIDSVLARLPEEFRQAVVLSDVADLDYPSIAELLGVPVGTVKSRVARGRAQLREVLGNPTERDERRMGEE